MDKGDIKIKDLAEQLWKDLPHTEENLALIVTALVDAFELGILSTKSEKEIGLWRLPPGATVTCSACGNPTAASQAVVENDEYIGNCCKGG